MTDVGRTGTQTWRRHHGRELTANVIVKAPGAYTIAVWHEPSGAARRASRIFPRLESAKAAADDLVRRSFAHSCSLDTCGEWIIWST
jgi:hypothetical protein